MIDLSIYLFIRHTPSDKYYVSITQHGQVIRKDSRRREAKIYLTQTYKRTRGRNGIGVKRLAGKRLGRKLYWGETTTVLGAKRLRVKIEAKRLGRKRGYD